MKMNYDVPRDWRRCITSNLRNRLVTKLKNAVVLAGDRMHYSPIYANKVEYKLYTKANSKAEYYQLLSKQIKFVQRRQGQVKHHTPVKFIRSGRRIRMSVSNRMIDRLNTEGFRKQNKVRRKQSKTLPHAEIIYKMNKANLQDWRHSLPQEKRSHIVNRFVEAILATSDPAAMLDKRMNSLNRYARRTEYIAFDKANSRSEYFQLLAEKILKIQIGLDEKRQTRNEEQMDC